MRALRGPANDEGFSSCNLMRTDGQDLPIESAPELPKSGPAAAGVAKGSR
jgi:hypothetical protein